MVLAKEFFFSFSTINYASVGMQDSWDLEDYKMVLVLSQTTHPNYPGEESVVSLITKLSDDNYL